jgi:hypothetical protein
MLVGVNASWDDLPEPARSIATVLAAAVVVARGAEADAYRVASAELAGLNGEQLGLVAGETVRLMLEDAYPDGLDAEDLRDTLELCVRAALPWYPELDPTALGTLLAGALGVHEADGQPLPLPPDAAAGHAPLLLAELSRGTSHPFPVYLRAALDGIATNQVMDLP